MFARGTYAHSMGRMKKTYLKRSLGQPEAEVRQIQNSRRRRVRRANIAAGEKLMEFGGELVNMQKALSPKYRERSVWLVGEGAYFALPTSDTRESLDEQLNHSCDANIWLTNEVTVTAMRDIAAGEEITLDHATWNFDEAAYADENQRCTCGKKNCRGVLTENDWKRADVQQRYRGHFHPAVQKLIDAG